MSHNEPEPKITDPEEPPSPSDETVKEPPPAPDDDAWAAPYEEHIDAEEPPSPKPKKKRHYGGIIVLVIVVLSLIVWTILSPKVLPQSHDTYFRDNDTYANLSGYSGNIKTWSGNATWALSVSGNNNTSPGSVEHISVLITKVSEHVSNGWFIGTGLKVSNVSLYTDNGTFVAKMSNKTNMGVGPLATIPVTFSEAKDYTLYVYVKFTVYADMRIGYLPMKAVEMVSESFTIHVA